MKTAAACALNENIHILLPTVTAAITSYFALTKLKKPLIINSKFSLTYKHIISLAITVVTRFIVMRKRKHTVAKIQFSGETFGVDNLNF